MIPRCEVCGRAKALDGFCGAGGASEGLHRAGFCVTGVDIKAFRRYPFRFVLGDAVSYIAEHGHEYALVAGSPPCKVYTDLARIAELSASPTSPRHVGLVEHTREAMVATGRPYLIENVPGAPLLDPVC